MLAHTCGQVITVFSDSRDHHYSPSTLICGDWAASATLCSCALVDDDCLRLILFRPVIRESKSARREFDEKFSEDVSTMMQVGVGCSLVTRSAPQLPQVLDMQGDESRRPVVENTLRVRRACWQPAQNASNTWSCLHDSILLHSSVLLKRAGAGL